MRYLHGSINQKVPVKVVLTEGLLIWKHEVESSSKSGLRRGEGWSSEGDFSSGGSAVLQYIQGK